MTDEQIDALKQAVESVLEYADYWQPYAPSVNDDARAILALVDAQAAEIERLREEPTLTITRAQFDEFVESAEDHTVLWTDTLALIGVYVAPCQTKIDVQDSRPNKGNDSAAQ